MRLVQSRTVFFVPQNKNQKNLDMETAKALLQLLLGKVWPLHAAFQEFLETQTHYKVINRDQWYNILEFSRSIRSDLSNYDEDGACECWIHLILCSSDHFCLKCVHCWIL